MNENNDIKRAIENFSTNQPRYVKSENYYKGNHTLTFATEKFKNAFGSLFREFADNLCPPVVDAVKDKLTITGFQVEEGETDSATKAWKIWQNNRMGKRAGEIHKEAIKNGDSYAIVWTDPAGKVTIYPQKAATCTVFYDAETPGKILYAAKCWQRIDKKLRLNLYYSDRIEKYISRSVGAMLNEKDLIPFTDDGEAIITNPFDVVPVFHFANNSDIGSFGCSELDQAMPIQDALNKSVLDMLVAAEFASYRQRYATGVDVEYDADGKPKAPFMAGVERLWVTENPEVKFGDFEATELKQFLNVQQSFRIEMATVTGTPLYYFALAEAKYPSGEALSKSETRFISKVKDRQESFGQVWEDLMSFALLLEGNAKASQLFVEWTDPAALSQKELLETLVLKKAVGVPEEQLWIEAGYGEKDIERMKELKKATAEAVVNAFNAGETDEE